MILLVDNTIDGIGSSPREIRSALERLHPDMRIVTERFENISPEHVKSLKPSHIILSGQSHPWDRYRPDSLAGVFHVICNAPQPTLGVCGGQQQIALAYGAPVGLMKRKRLHCVTTNISCPQGTLTDRVLYSGNNLMQRLSRLYRPFSTGMFMLFDKTCFDTLGGFNEEALFAEDYMLSKEVARNRFAIVRGCVNTTNRRFKTMGHLPIVRLFLRTALNTWNNGFFLRDHKYWHSEA